MKFNNVIRMNKTKYYFIFGLFWFSFIVIIVKGELVLVFIWLYSLLLY